mmetsp:Transcript_22104/g.41553  ORF Transcript_22104/g.41553 Transcript_22104/m.41553 type:complete len:243 (+) Transcript_22104:162-890(+)
MTPLPSLASFSFAILSMAPWLAPMPTVLVTVETPSTNFVLKIVLALLNMPSLRLTTMNWDWLKCVRSMLPMFWVWLKSRAASTSSRMYMGAGLNSSILRIRLRASRLLCPPLSSVRLSFQTSPNATLTSRPSQHSSPSGGSSFAVVPGSSVEKMLPKSLLTLVQVRASSFFFFSSSSRMTFSIFFLSFSMTFLFLSSSVYSPSAFSIMPMTFLLIFLLKEACSLLRAFKCSDVTSGSCALKS